jgi:hypothetical protein
MRDYLLVKRYFRTTQKFAILMEVSGMVEKKYSLNSGDKPDKPLILKHQFPFLQVDSNMCEYGFCPR